MKIVNIIGGLGNQMFQCAFAMALKKHYPNEEVYIDTSHYNYIFVKKIGPMNMHNGYEIEEVFSNFNIPTASSRKLKKVSWHVPNFVLSRVLRKFLPKKKAEYTEKRNFTFYDDVFAQNGDRYFDGYWQCAKYFEDIKPEVIKAFAFPPLNEYSKGMVKQIEATESVGIHVRRGDFLKDSEFGGICGLGYLSDAIKEILKEKKQYTFFVFSNDINWCKENLAPLISGHEIVFTNGNRGKESIFDMYLMSPCKNLIIANSSFSWWGAFFNTQGGKVIAPHPWIDRNQEFDIYGSEWIKIESSDREFSNYKKE